MRIHTIINKPIGLIIKDFSHVFFTSDTHFGSKRTYELSKRDIIFPTISNMDVAMVERWNKVVSPKDTVIHLGDFGDLETRKALNGKIILIQGNYEEDIPDEDFNKYFNDEDVYFKGTNEKHASAFIANNGCNYLLTHRPLDCPRENVDVNTNFSLFGHIHGRQFIKKFGIDVGVDCNKFTPMSYETVEFYRNAIAKGYYDENVFC